MRVGVAISFVVVNLFLCFPNIGFSAGIVNVLAQPINYRSRLFFSPRNQTITTDSEFDVSLYIDTAEFSINTLNIQIDFPANLVSVTRPSNGESVIDLWVSPPKYSNSRGTIDFAGTILGGVKTSSGLIEKITFRAKTPGTGAITIRKTSQILINDGFGTETEIEIIPLKITVESKAPDGVQIISGTHPFQGVWSNNKNPVFSWTKQLNDESYSYLLDDKPFTAPDDEIEGTDNQIGYENIKDGVWYFHIKAKADGLWSIPSHYTIRVDTILPAQFTPVASFMADSEESPAIVSFFSTDALSGIDHYEVGIIPISMAPDTLPGFLESESPYYMPKKTAQQDALVTVRAVDRAGNVRDETINIHISPPLLSTLKNHSNQIALGSSILILILSIGLSFISKRRQIKRQLILSEERPKIIEYIERPRIVPVKSETSLQVRENPDPNKNNSYS